MHRTAMLVTAFTLTHPHRRRLRAGRGHDNTGLTMSATAVDFSLQLRGFFAI